MHASPVSQDVVLVGGGHGHVEVLRRFAMAPLPGVRLTLIARELFAPYSGMLPGLIAGHYHFDEAHVDLQRLARCAGARLFHGAARGLDLGAGTVRVEGRPPVAFDYLSLDVGSRPGHEHIDGAARWAIPARPVDAFLRRLPELETRVRRHRGPFRLLVVGAGAGGIELALALERRLGGGEPGGGLRIVVAGADAEPLPGHGAGARRRVCAALARRGVVLRCGHPVTALSEGRARVAGGPDIAFDAALLATGARPAPWLARCGLALDASGFVRVRDTLQSLSHARVLAAGDVAAFAPRPLAKSGVYAVRAGPVLAENLRRLVRGEALRPFRPRRRVLALVSTGRRHAVASWGRLGAQGKWAWRLKDRIDRRWMRRYQDLPPMRPPTPRRGAAPLPATAMRCGGCGAKLADPVLRAALARIPPGPRRGVVVGLDAPDDAAVIEVPRGALLVQSVDHFRPFVDDPWLFGRITAEHCLGDLFAMGARAHSAQAMVTLAYGRPEKLEEELFQLLCGAAEALSEAGAALVGGHTSEGPEPAFGLSVNGFAARAALTRKGGARPGDRLVLTKALGTGVIFAADMHARAPAGSVQAALASMRTSNRRAAGLLAAHGARACTDVTGFGLLGHLIEMLNASGVRARVEGARLPLLPGAEELLRRGFASTLHAANEAFGVRLDAPAADAGRRILFDPQTSGGLLASLPAAAAAPCADALREAGYERTALIGEILPGGAGALVDLA